MNERRTVYRGEHEWHEEVDGECEKGQKEEDHVLRLFVVRQLYLHQTHTCAHQ